MIYEVMKPATGVEPGETYSPEDLAKKGDIATMVRKGIVRQVGFVSQGSPMNDSEAARLIAELQKKLEKAEDERDEARDEIKSLKRQVKALEDGHKEGARQLKEAIDRAAALERDLSELLVK